MKNFVFKFNNLYAFIFLFIVIFALHADVVFAPLNYYFSSFDLKDLNYFINIRLYAAKSILSGIFPLWIPEIFCGHPFFANSETAVLYPLNFIFLFLPISKAINISFILHFIIFSFSVYLWINNKIKDKFIALFTALSAAFFTSFYIHSCAGHLSNIITMTWVPFLFLLYDKSFEKETYINIIPVSIIIALQIFAGHFQYVYYTALVSFFYIVVFCRSKKTFITYAVSYFIALLLCAVQLLPSIDFYMKGIRLKGALQHFSLKFSLSDIAAFICPKYIELNTELCFWEKVCYIGSCNIFIIIFSMLNNFNREKFKYLCTALLIYLFASDYAGIAAEYIIPLFKSFRSPVKLSFFVSVLLMPLLAYSVKDFFYNNKNNSVLPVAIVVFAAVISLLLNLNVRDYTEVFLILTFVVLFFFRRFLFVKIIILLIAVSQPIIFSKKHSVVCYFSNDCKYEQAFINGQNNDVRFFSNYKYSLKYNYENIFGTSSDVLARYYILVRFLETQNDHTNIYVILRNKYVVEDMVLQPIDYNISLLNRVNVFYKYIVENNYKNVLQILSDTQNKFDVFNNVILEKEPYINIEKKGEYSIDNLKLSKNYMEADIKTTEPAVILFTDNYETGWKAFDKNTKQKFEIIPAYKTLKAICLDKGNYNLRLEYRPLPFVFGLAVSALAWIVFVITALVIYFKRKKKYFN